MNNLMTLNELIAATEQARANYRLHGTLVSEIIYKSFYVRLGKEAFEQNKLEIKCPVTLAEMHRLAIDAP